jgi:hypothetical protein
MGERMKEPMRLATVGDRAASRRLSRCEGSPTATPAAGVRMMSLSEGSSRNSTMYSQKNEARKDER